MARRFTVLLCSLILLGLVSAALPAANIAVPSLDIVTRGFMNGPVLELESRGEFTLEVEGGYKFGGRIAFSYADSLLEQLDATDGLALQGVAVTIREPLSLPVALSWFIGELDTFGSGDAFPELFGTAPVASAYRGFLYFPTATAYDGVHTVKGTGLRFDVAAVPQRLILSAYLYQDSWFTVGAPPYPALEPGHFAFDFRVLASLESVRIEGFLGLSAASVVGLYRGGMLFHAASTNLELLVAAGVPRYDPLVDPFGMDLFFLLFEPRVHLGMFSLVPTFFWHPGWYHQALTGEVGSFDVNLNLSYGDLAKSVVLGGLEGTVTFVAATGIFSLRVSPYMRLATAGALWDLKVSAKLWPFDPADLAEGYVGIQAAF